MAGRAALGRALVASGGTILAIGGATMLVSTVSMGVARAVVMEKKVGGLFPGLRMQSVGRGWGRSSASRPKTHPRATALAHAAAPRSVSPADEHTAAPLPPSLQKKLAVSCEICKGRSKLSCDVCGGERRQAASSLVHAHGAPRSAPSNWVV
jgi:hypothetical protein